MKLSQFVVLPGDMRLAPRVQEAMQMQVEAERKKRAAVLESEGLIGYRHVTECNLMLLEFVYVAPFQSHFRPQLIQLGCSSSAISVAEKSNSSNIITIHGHL